MTTTNHRSQLVLFFVVVIFLFAVFFITPSLQAISLMTVLNVVLLHPLVRFMTKKGMNRLPAILLVFAVSGLIVGISINELSQIVLSQWPVLVQSIPAFLNKLLLKIQEFETLIQHRIGLEFEFGLSTMVSEAGSKSTSWLITHATSILSSIASITLLVPVFSFFILKDGRHYASEILKLIPNQYLDEVVLTLKKTSVSLGKFIRAKAIEAFLVSLLTYIGLLICGAEYAVILALLAGITNILPYLGPVLGYIPAIALLGFNWPVTLVYLIVNAIDMLLIFPILVGKLVNLSPLTLLVAVAVGQELYGLIGMLLSVPIAASMKIIYQEVVSVLYTESSENPEA
jgi:putative permease